MFATSMLRNLQHAVRTATFSVLGSELRPRGRYPVLEVIKNNNKKKIDAGNHNSGITNASNLNRK